MGATGIIQATAAPGARSRWPGARALRAWPHVLIDEVEATIPRHEGRNLLAVFDQLSTHALTDGRVRLLGLDTTVTGGKGGVSNLPAAELRGRRGHRLRELPARSLHFL